MGRYEIPRLPYLPHVSFVLILQLVYTIGLAMANISPISTQTVTRFQHVLRHNVVAFIFVIDSVMPNATRIFVPWPKTAVLNSDHRLQQQQQQHQRQ